MKNPIRNTWNIARRDFRSYFTSPIAYVLIGGFLAIMGFMFFFSLQSFNEQNLQYQQYNMGKPLSITERIVGPLYGNMNVILLFIIPFITMRLFAEERKNQTLALLLTSPITLLDIILGKFLSSVMLVGVMLLLTFIYPAILFWTGNPDGGAILTCFLGTFLLACSLLSVGLLFSAMTENQIVAGAITFATSLLLWLISWGAYSAGPVWSDILMHLSIINHFMNSFAQGMVSSVDVIYYLSFIFTGLFLTHRVLDSYRWR
jgi:ABC-2 type transport system permease protein